MKHILVVTEENAVGVLFTCSVCGVSCQFQHSPMSPSPIRDEVNATWLPPADPEQWMGPCS